MRIFSDLSSGLAKFGLVNYLYISYNVCMSTQTFNISMPKKLIERIDDQTKRQGSNRSDFVRIAVRKQLAALEQWDAVTAQARKQYKGERLSEDEVAQIVREQRAL